MTSDVRCTYCDGNGWIYTGRTVAPPASGGFICDIAIAETIRCPVQCESGIHVRAVDVGARSHA